MLEVLGGHCPTQLHSPTFLVWHRPGVFAEGEFCLIQSLKLGGALEGLELGPEQELLELFRACLAGEQQRSYLATVSKALAD